MERAARYGSHAFLFVNLSIGEQEDKYSISIMITQNDLKNAHPKKDREDLSLLPIREATITYLERVSISEYNQTWDENFTYDPFSYSYNTRNTKFYVLKRKKIYFGVLESLDNYTA
ncbi:hypothetical protein PN650_23055, partial [Parabacteroides distasonis]|nr:hypothetical protein [Parabacteroides distasonis]